MKIERERICVAGRNAPVRATKGFSIIELLVAMAVFLTVAAAAFSLFSQNTSLATHQATLSSVNIGLRNAISQVEMDLSGAGQNVLAGVEGVQPFSPGVVVQNSVPGVAAACAPNAATWAYPAASACFDSLTTIVPKQCTIGGATGPAPVLAIDEPSPGPVLSTTTGMTAFDPNDPTRANLSNEQGCYQTGDEMLVVELPSDNAESYVPCDSGSFNFCLGVFRLTASATIGKSPTNAALNDFNLAYNSVTGSASGNDPLGIFFNAAGTTNWKSAKALTSPIPAGYAFLVDLGTGTGDVTYQVQTNPANAADTQLVRCTGTVCAPGAAEVLADQVIGFKVGAALFSSGTQPTDLSSYSYNASSYCNGSLPSGAWPPPPFVDCTPTPPPANDPYDFALVRSIRVSLIGRTPPGGDMDLTKSKFQNGFDGGPYLVQQASVVVNLRGISISEFGN